MSSHLATGDARPKFDPKNQFRLYSMLYGPYPQRARLVIAAKGLTNYDIVNVKLGAELPEWYKSINPLGKVPAIEFKNGDKVYESLIVADLLDELYPEKPLNPSDPVEKAKQRLFVDTFDHTFIPSFINYARGKTDENKEKLLARLSECEKHLANGKTPFFGGGQPAMVDYMIWPFLERLPTIYSLSDKVHPNLTTWFNQMQNVPAVMEASLPLEIYKKISEIYSSGRPLDYDLV